MKQLLFILILCSGTIAGAQVKLGFVDMQKLLDTMPYRKIALEKYHTYEKELEVEFMILQQEFERLYADYQNYHGESHVQRQALEKKVIEKQTLLEQRQKGIPIELQQYGDELNTPIFERIQGAIKIVAEKQRLTLIVDKTTTLYFDSTLDITMQVIAELMTLESPE